MGFDGNVKGFCSALFDNRSTNLIPNSISIRWVLGEVADRHSVSPVCPLNRRQTMEGGEALLRNHPESAASSIQDLRGHLRR